MNQQAVLYAARREECAKLSQAILDAQREVAWNTNPEAHEALYLAFLRAVLALSSHDNALAGLMAAEWMTTDPVCPVCGEGVREEDDADLRWPASPVGKVHAKCRAEAVASYEEYLAEQDAPARRHMERMD